MKTETYGKQCDAGRLTQEIVSAGLVIYPNSEYRFYGCSVTTLQDSSWLTTIHFVDDISSEEVDIVSALVESHIPIPLPPVSSPLDSDNKPFVRAESRPLDCTTCFTSCGDFLATGSIPNAIGGGNRLDWDASISEQWTTDGAPSGFKQRKVEVQFCDSVWIKEGTFYYMNVLKGSYLDMEVICPHGGYYMYLGEIQQNLTGSDLVVEHYIYKAGMQGDCPMGDELNTETCSQELPSYLKFRLTITIPVSDTESNGSLLLELYRKRTVIL